MLSSLERLLHPRRAATLLATVAGAGLLTFCACSIRTPPEIGDGLPAGVGGGGWTQPDAGTSCTTLALTQEGATVVRPPALVSVNFKVANGCSGAPVSAVDAFAFFEDGAAISGFEAAAAQAARNSAYRAETLLLLDLSGSITRSNTLPTLKETAKAFADLVLAKPNRKVAVHAFDGQATLHPIVDFSGDRAEIDQAIDALSCPNATYCADTSTDLNGAVIHAIDVLGQQLRGERSSNPGAVVNGSVVVFSDGADRAERATLANVVDAVKATSAAVMSVALASPELDSAALRTIGRDGYFEATDLTQLGAAFGQVADRIEAEAASHYSATLCSDRRNAATHTFGVGATKGAMTGRLEVQFSSDGFGGGCTLPQ